MKKSAIQYIFDNLRDGMAHTNPRGKNSKSLDIINDTYDELKEKLSPELLSLHQKIVDALEDTWYEETDLFFAEGFKLGLLVGIECTE